MLIEINSLFSRHGIKPDGILHLGANTGQEADSYAALGVKNVIWIEAVPHIYSQLMRHLQRFPGNVAHLACVGEDTGKEVEFYISNNDAQSSSYLALKHHKVIHPHVEYTGSFKTKIVRLDELLAAHAFGGNWFLNMDLQGTELPAIRGLGALIKHFKWIYSEINTKEVYENGTMVTDLDAYLQPFGFARVETSALVEDSWGDALYVRK